MIQEDEKQSRLKKIVARVRTSEICSIRNIVSRVIKIINDPESTVMDLKEIVQIDPPLTGKLLQLANSAYYAPQKKICEIQEAMIWVGFDSLKELAMSQKICEVFKGESSVLGFSRTLLWKHCIAVAMLGKMIFRREFGEKGEEIYAAGLLHDLGIIAMEQFCQTDFKKIINKTKADHQDQTAAENEVLGFDHAEIGRAITDDWDFPQELVQIIGGHHNPETNPQEFARIGSTLYVADYVCQQRHFGYQNSASLNEKRFKRCLKNLGLTSYALDLIFTDVESEILRMEEQGLL
ncbi:MAG: HDOD domain-containing protein [Deltaproteobacteria bacterium]|nr:HDOD domain-containing protein [Deltaproteobacteria bacterium]